MKTVRQTQMRRLRGDTDTVETRKVVEQLEDETPQEI
jgi:hypothetical protein